MATSSSVFVSVAGGAEGPVASRSVEVFLDGGLVVGSVRRQRGGGGEGARSCQVCGGGSFEAMMSTSLYSRACGATRARCGCLFLSGLAAEVDVSRPFRVRGKDVTAFVVRDNAFPLRPQVRVVPDLHGAEAVDVSSAVSGRVARVAWSLREMEAAVALDALVPDSAKSSVLVMVSPMSMGVHEVVVRLTAAELFSGDGSGTGRDRAVCVSGSRSRAVRSRPRPR